MILAVGMIGEDDGEVDLSKSLATAVWIDQICINQSDNAEKSDQVKRMHWVYEKAENTIVYLGEPAEQTPIAFEAAYALASLEGVDDDKIPLNRKVHQGELTRPPKRLDWAAIRNVPEYTPRYFEFEEGAGDKIHPFRTFALDILGRRWWHRTWVLQEIVCSREAEIMIDKFKIPWKTCLAACSVASKLGYAELFTANTTAHEIEQLEELREQYRAETDAVSSDLDNLQGQLKLFKSMAFRTIPQILPKAMYKGVTEPRDKIFALFNIATEISLPALRSQYLSLVDYDLPLRTVYIRACELWHAGSSSPFTVPIPGESSRELSFIDWVLDTTENDKISLPSWVPHWMQHGPVAMARAPGCEAGLGQDKDAPRTHVIFPSSDQYAQDEVPLTVRGIQLFSIHRTCGDVSQTKTYAEHAVMLSQFSDPYPTTNLSYLQAYRRAITPEEFKFRCSEYRTCKFWDFMKISSGNTYGETKARLIAYTEKDVTSVLPMTFMMSLIGYNKYLCQRKVVLHQYEWLYGIGANGCQRRGRGCAFFRG